MADVDVSKIKLPGDNNDYILKDAKKTGIYTVIGTQTSSTSSWTGNISVPSLYDGLTIMYYLPYASTSSNVTLNLTLSTGIPTGAISCYYGTSRLTTHYNKGCNIVMTYWSAGSISVDGTATTSNRWIANANYYVNTDSNVKQNNVSNNKDYRILLSKSDNDTAETNTVGKSGTLIYNPSTCKFTNMCDADSNARIQVTNSTKTSGIYLEHGIDDGKSIGWHDGQYMYPLILVDANSNVSFGNKMAACVRNTAIDEYSSVYEEYVGTWTDGNPLYRFVMKVSTSVTSWSIIGSIAIEEDHVAFADFYCKAPSSSGYTLSQSYYTGSHDMFRAALQWNNNDKNYKLYAQLGSTYPAKPAEITAIIHYTKTTS